MKKLKDSAALAESVIKGMAERKANDIISLDLRKLDNAVCSFFVICHGDSNVHVNAIADSIVDFVGKDLGDKPWSKEGTDTSEWILLDYGDVVAHVFQKEQRDFYRIEDLWADAEINQFTAPDPSITIG